MGLTLGWRPKVSYDGAWPEDPAFKDVPPEVLAEWAKDGQALHLMPYAKNGEPTVFQWRALDGDARRFARSFLDGEGTVSRMFAVCFRLGAEFKAGDGEDFRVELPSGEVATGMQRTVKEGHLRMLAKEFVDALDINYPGLVDFYGALIWQASVPSVQEKKASSPPSTPQKSTSDTVATETTVATPVA